MTKTVTLIQRASAGNMKMRIVDITISSYTATGEPLDANNLGLLRLDALIPVGKGTGYEWEYDVTNKKIKVYNSMPQHTHNLLITGGQAAGDALQQLSNVVGKTVAGNVTAAGGASNIQNASAAAGSEVAAATNCGTCRALAIGI